MEQRRRCFVSLRRASSHVAHGAVAMSGSAVAAASRRYSPAVALTAHALRAGMSQCAGRRISGRHRGQLRAEAGYLTAWIAFTSSVGRRGWGGLALGSRRREMRETTDPKPPRRWALHRSWAGPAGECRRVTRRVAHRVGQR